MNSLLWEEIRRRIEKRAGERKSEGSPGSEKRKRGALTVAIVGAGGKSTTTMVLAEKAAASGFRAIATTSTNIGSGPEVLRRANGEHDAARLVVFDQVGRHCKGPRTESEWEELQASCDVLLVEADGARRMGFKVPLEHEPVWPPRTDLVLVLFSAGEIGKPLEEACFRIDRAREFLRDADFDPSGESPEGIEELTPYAAAILLERGYLADRIPEGAEAFVVCNQCDGGERLETAKRIEKSLSGLTGERGASVGFFPNSYSREELAQRPEGM